MKGKISELMLRSMGLRSRCSKPTSPFHKIDPMIICIRDSASATEIAEMKRTTEIIINYNYKSIKFAIISLSSLMLCTGQQRRPHARCTYLYISQHSIVLTHDMCTWKCVDDAMFVPVHICGRTIWLQIQTKSSSNSYAYIRRVFCIYLFHVFISES